MMALWVVVSLVLLGAALVALVMLPILVSGWIVVVLFGVWFVFDRWYGPPLPWS